MHAPKHLAVWNSEPTAAECTQVPKLLARIAALKKKGLTVERVAYSFMKRRIQPLMERVHLGYEYTGDNDESCMATGPLSNDLIMERLAKMFKGLKADVPKVVLEFGVARPPKQVSSHGEPLSTNLKA